MSMMPYVTSNLLLLFGSWKWLAPRRWSVCRSPAPDTWDISSRLWEHRGGAVSDRRCDSCHHSHHTKADGPQQSHSHTPGTCIDPPGYAEEESLYSYTTYRILKLWCDIFIQNHTVHTLLEGAMFIRFNAGSSCSIGSSFTSVTAILTETHSQRTTECLKYACCFRKVNIFLLRSYHILVWQNMFPSFSLSRFELRRFPQVQIW